MSTELALPMPLSVPEPVAASRPIPARTRVPSALRRPFAALFAFLVAVLAVYAPVLSGQFLWDDVYLVQDNQFIRSPLCCLEAFRHMLFNDDSRFYRPTQTLTYIFDYWCWGLDPYGYHLTNALIHAANAFLLFLLLRRVLPAVVPLASAGAGPRPATDRAAFGLALLWALHPVHSATVAYVSGRADSLAMAFCLTAWLACERALASARPVARGGWAAGAFVCLLLGLCSKEIAFVWLVLFAGWLFALRRDPSPSAPRVTLRTKLMVIAGGLLALGCYLCLRQLAPVPPPPPPLPMMPPRGVLMLRALGDYFGLLLFPYRLHMEREVFAPPGFRAPQSPVFYFGLAAAGVLLLGLFAAGALLPGRGRRLRCCGAGWFLVAFLPISNLFMLNASVAEHWLYLPSIGFLLFAAGVALDVPWGRLPVPRLRWLPAAAVAVGLAAGALGLRTWLRAHDWTDRLTFYQQTIRDGGDVPRARQGLAIAYHEVGNEEAAAAVLRHLTAEFPQILTARMNLATTSVRLGQTDQARKELRTVADGLLSGQGHHGALEYIVAINTLDRIAPADDPTWAALRGRLLDADSRFPNSWEFVQFRALERINAQDLPGALALVTRFADAHWWQSSARGGVARLLAALGRTDDALAACSQAERLDVHDAEAFSFAADLCAEHGRLPEAVVFQENAVHRQPDSPRQHLLLARLLEQDGRGEEAGRERAVATQIARSENG